MNIKDPVLAQKTIIKNCTKLNRRYLSNLSAVLPIKHPNGQVAARFEVTWSLLWRYEQNDFIANSSKIFSDNNSFIKINDPNLLIDSTFKLLIIFWWSEQSCKTGESFKICVSNEQFLKDFLDRSLDWTEVLRQVSFFAFENNALCNVKSAIPKRFISSFADK